MLREWDKDPEYRPDDPVQRSVELLEGLEYWDDKTVFENDGETKMTSHETNITLDDHGWWSWRCSCGESGSGISQDGERAALADAASSLKRHKYVKRMEEQADDVPVWREHVRPAPATGEDGPLSLLLGLFRSLHASDLSDSPEEQVSVLGHIVHLCEEQQGDLCAALDPVGPDGWSVPALMACAAEDWSELVEFPEVSWGETGAHAAGWLRHLCGALKGSASQAGAPVLATREDDRPEVFTLPVVLCPSCGHGIDPHKPYGDPADPCGVGGCLCLWSPNDVAGTLLEQEQQRQRRETPWRVWVRLPHAMPEANAEAALLYWTAAVCRTLEDVPGAEDAREYLGRIVALAEQETGVEAGPVSGGPDYVFSVRALLGDFTDALGDVNWTWLGDYAAGWLQHLCAEEAS